MIAASGYGLHQVLYTTAVGQEGYKDQNGLGKSPSNMFDPQTSLDLGTEYLARMFVQTDGTEQSDYIGRQDLQFQFAPALRAFNASLRDGFTVVDAKNICPTPPPTQKTLRNNTCMPSKYVIVGY